MSTSNQSRYGDNNVGGLRQPEAGDPVASPTVVRLPERNGVPNTPQGKGETPESETAIDEPSSGERSRRDLTRQQTSAHVSRLVLRESSPRRVPAGAAPAASITSTSGTGGAPVPSLASDYTGLRRRIHGRVFVLIGEDAENYADVVNDACSGLVIGGKGALEEVRRMAHSHPDRMLAVDPWLSEKVYASEEAPFILEVADEDAPALLPAPTLEEYLQAQIKVGATFATTPTGVMRAGDRRTLKKAIRQVNDLDRDDVVFYVPLEPAWFTLANIKGLIGVLSACEHPVAIAIADSNGDPYTKVLPALRSVVASLSYAMMWRSDLAGLDLMAHGAKAASIGVLPAKRAAKVPDSFRRASDKTDRRPQVLRPELLRYVRTSYMRDEWYAATEPQLCWCKVCDGREIDRFSKATESRLEAHRHNAVTLVALIENVGNLVGDKNWWRVVARDAVAEHTVLGGQLGRKVEPPASVDAFADA